MYTLGDIYYLNYLTIQLFQQFISIYGKLKLPFGKKIHTLSQNSTNKGVMYIALAQDILSSLLCT